MCPVKRLDNKKVKSFRYTAQWLQSTGKNKWKVSESEEVKDVQVGTNQAGRKSE